MAQNRQPLMEVNSVLDVVLVMLNLQTSVQDVVDHYKNCELWQ